jgi:spore coat polysaccharide biosynthesis protein SpsF (cytidylyltransferase family)
VNALKGTKNDSLLKEHKLMFRPWGWYKNVEGLHLSLDTPNDYELLKNIFHHVYLKNKEFTLEDVLNYLNHKN